MTGNNFIRQSNSGESRLSHRISFIHHKGGTGKTTACLNIAGWLTKMNQQVLVVDLDPQANATSGLGVDLKSIDSAMNDVLLEQTSIKDIILETNSGVYLAPASVKLLSVETELAYNFDAVSILKNKLDEINNYFDFILVDSPPGFTLLMMNGIIATENIIIPMDSGVFGYETLETLKQLILNLEDEFNVKINIIMALLREFSPSIMHNGFTKKIHNMINEYFSINGLQNCTISKVSFSKKICQAQMRGLPISHYAPHSQISKIYQNIARNILRYFVLEGQHA